MATSIFAPVARNNKALVEFRAGKMNVSGSTVSPDKRKGLIQLVQSPDDNLIHFKWKDRTTGVVETDLIIFPDEATFKRVKQAKTGRVYLLEWKTTSRRMFFWMQEPSEDKDEEYCAKINQYMNNPPQSGGGGGGGLDQNQLFQLMQGSLRGAGQTRATTAVTPTPASPSTEAPSSTPSSETISQSYLQNVLSGLGVQGGLAQSQQREDTNLEFLMTPETLLPLLENPEIQQQLLPHLPEGHRTPEELRQIVHSPQFQQALQSLNAALQSGQLSELMPHFGIPPSVGGSEGGVNALLRALQEQAASQRQQQQQPQQQPQQQQGEKMDVDTEESVPPLVDDDKAKKQEEKKDEKKDGDDKPSGS